jgi:hypothetical protein
MDLTPAQLDIVQAPLDAKIFLSGYAGTGKTSAAVERLKSLLAQGVRADSILLLAPQRSLHEPYLESLYLDPYAGGEVTPATLGGLARRMVDLFWPLVAEAGGFARPDLPPVFLTLETAQYYMAHLVRPLLDEGFFESVTIDRNRLYSQVIDNLNKSAVIGFPHTEIGARLDLAFSGDPAQRRVYADAQECANRFRAYCLQNNLLDFSLQLEIFANVLWPQPQVRDYLARAYRHLIYDNVEEDGPRAHDILREWIADFDSALLVYDEGGSFRYFLGADMDTGASLRELCDQQVLFDESFVMSQPIADLSEHLPHAIAPGQVASPVSEATGIEALSIIQSRFYPEMLDVVAGEVRQLLDGGLAPAEVVILAPYLSDALRFSLTHRLERLGIPWRSHRPSRSLRDEPASQTLLTLAALAHPHWEIRPPKFDVAYALMLSIDGLDLVRAQLLTEIVYRPRELALAPFDGIKPEVQERITFSLGLGYSILRDWLLAQREAEPLPLDHFLRKLFGEVLSQPGFGYHADFDRVRVAASLIESFKKFRLALDLTGSGNLSGLGREYIAMLQDGVIAASYVEAWRQQNTDAVLVAPAHTFLLMNRPAAVQFWLDPGSSGWYERLAQPLTHPYVLARGWPDGQLWSDADEVRTSQAAMSRLIGGLLRRCREQVYLGLAELGEAGFEQRGELLRAFQKILQGQAS